MSQLIAQLYDRLPQAVSTARTLLGRPMTFAEKVLYSHLYDPPTSPIARGELASFRPDRVALQDVTAQMALLQLMNAGNRPTAVPATVHCDHLIEAHLGAAQDLAVARTDNAEVYGFLRAVADKYGLGFWEPGAGIMHQVVLETYAFPGGLLIGTDSHTPNAGGLGTCGVGVGGSDAVDAMTGMEWELRMPKLIGVVLTGRLNAWTSAKDIILALAGILGVKGGTNAIIEYIGPGAAALSATGKATICNMGAEVGATSSLFGFETAMSDYLKATGREDIAELATRVAGDLTADPEVLAAPHDFFDTVIELDLTTLEPHVNGPFTPDRATPISQLGAVAETNGWPLDVEAGLIGSCTNSSYQDLARAASVARQALEQGMKLACPLYINPGSARTEATAERDGLLAPLRELGAVILADACGPCIGQWHRPNNPDHPNTIVTSFNRNFAKRNDGNPLTHAFVASPEMVMALSLSGRLDVNPVLGPLTPSTDIVLPGSFVDATTGYIEPTFSDVSIQVDPDSPRLALLEPFPAWDGRPIVDAALLIKVAGKCTTDHISPAGPWLAYRGHLAKISDNMLSGAIDAFTGQTANIAQRAREYQNAGRPTIVVAEENYGEGSSREHAAMEPRFLGVVAVIAKSFARIHETNLKKQGMLACTFTNPGDYDLIRQDDRLSIPDLAEFAPGRGLTLVLDHADGTTESVPLTHTYSQQQIEWFKAGSALNLMSAKEQA